MNVASIYVLERKLIAEGRDADILWQSPDDWGDDLGAALDEWIERGRRRLAYSIVAAIAVIDVETVIIDGAFPIAVRRRIIEQTRVALAPRQPAGPVAVPARRRLDRQRRPRHGRRLAAPARQLHAGPRSAVQGCRARALSQGPVDLGARRTPAAAKSVRWTDFRPERPESYARRARKSPNPGSFLWLPSASPPRSSPGIDGIAAAIGGKPPPDQGKGDNHDDGADDENDWRGCDPPRGLRRSICADRRRALRLLWSSEATPRRTARFPRA